MATWTNLTFAFGSLLTSTKMTQLDANLDALAEGASGAPNVAYAAFDATLKGQVAKGWILFNGTGTIAILDSFNVTSITDNGTGDYTITWATDFASASYCVQTSAGNNAGGVGLSTAPDSYLVGSVNIRTFSLVGSSTDYDRVNVIAFGDQ